MFPFGDMSRSEIAVSRNISIMLLLLLINFGMLYFQFNFPSEYFLISFVISSLIHLLFGSGFDFHICLNSPDFFLSDF